MSTAMHSRSSLSPAQVAERDWSQRCLTEALRRLSVVYEGRHATALPGVSHQYISKVLAGGTPCSLTRFVQLLGPLDRGEREFVLQAWTEDARQPDKPPLIEIAEANEAAGEALGAASRILAEPRVCPRELGKFRLSIHRAERELEDVEQAIAGGAR